MSAFRVVDGGGTAEEAWMAASARIDLPALEVGVPRRAVVLAPHPDDEVLGAGGLLRALVAAGTAVEVWAVTDGEAAFGPLGATEARALAARRSRESLDALARLGAGAATRRRLGVPDGQAADAEDTVAAGVAAALAPGDLCVATWRGDGHPDHEAVGRAAASGAAACGCRLLEYPVWAWYWADPAATGLPRAPAHLLRMDRRSAAAKRRAVAAFASQVRPGPLGAPAVLPAAVLRYFRRPVEVYLG